MLMLRQYLRCSSLNPRCFTGLAPLFSPITHTHYFTSLPNPSPIPQNPSLYHYLIDSFAFPKSLALSVSCRYSYINTPEKPQSVVQLLRHLGFSDAQIGTSVRALPRVLFADVEKNLKPKFHFFQQELGLSGSRLGKLISKNPYILTRSLNNTLKPRVETLKKVLENEDVKNEDLILILQRCRLTTESRFLSNVSYLKSCGIVGPRLLKLLTRQPRLLDKQESVIRKIVSRVLDMGFSTNLSTFANAVRLVGGLRNETIIRKLQLFQSFGFSEDEFLKMFRKLPLVISTSEEKLKLRIEFCRNVLKFDNKVLLDRPAYLTYSLEDRVVPRYELLQLMKSKGLFKKEPSLFYVLTLTEKEFLKWMMKYVNGAEGLSVLYKGRLLKSPEK